EALGLKLRVMIALDVGAASASHRLPQVGLGDEALEILSETIDIPFRAQECALPVDDHLGNVSMGGGDNGHARRRGLDDRDRCSALAVTVASGDARAQENVMLEEQLLEHRIWLKADPIHHTPRRVDQRQDLTLLLLVPGLAGAVSDERHLESWVTSVHALDRA